MAKEIRIIEAKKPDAITLKRVAAYARVSTDAERLMHSLSAQVSYYSELIQKTPGWQYAGVYADEGITGTKLKARTEFQRMIADCEAGKIDIILTKSISRFARNTVDTLSTVRHLKSLGIEVRFEKENISSIGEDGELLITLLASFAQEEIRSLSDNVRWGTIKRFQQGLPNGHFRIFGYDWEGDKLVINPEEAAIVRRIYQNFLDGKSRLETEREFAAEGITTKGGFRWVDSNIKVVLTNITYTGNMLFMKEYIEDPITKKRRKNHGELEQYYVENTHEPIIDMDTFRFVQDEMARRKELGPLANKALNTSVLTGRIKCGHCGLSYMHNTRKNRAVGDSIYGERYVTWCCGSRKKAGGLCDMKEIPDIILKQKCAEVLGLDEFDESVFDEQIERIDVPENGILVFIFRDGTSRTVEWKSTAKHDCWTEEFKARQREWMRSYRANSDSVSEFSTRIHCGVCGRDYRRDSQKRNGETAHYWRCGANSTCGRKGLREDYLQKYSAEVMGLAEYDPAAFREQVEYIEVVSDTEIAFHFMDGRIVPHDWPKRYPRPGWTPEQRAKFMESAKKAFPPERRKAMSEKMKEIRRTKKWPLKSDK